MKRRSNQEDFDIIGSRPAKPAPDMGPLFGTPPDRDRPIDRMKTPVLPPGATRIGEIDPIERKVPLAHVAGSDTSEAAARAHEGHAVTQRVEVFRFIESKGRMGATRKEVKRALSLDSSSATPRVLELIQLREVVEVQSKRDGSHVVIAAQFIAACPGCDAGNRALGKATRVCNRCWTKYENADRQANQ